MEHDLRPFRLEQPHHRRPVPHVAQGEAQIDACGAVPQLVLDLVEVEFALIDQNQPLPAPTGRSGGRVPPPIVPPAPVTSTRRPAINSAIAP